jgi:hypothetical protein
MLFTVLSRVSVVYCFYVTRELRTRGDITNHIVIYMVYAHKSELEHIQANFTPFIVLDSRKGEGSVTMEYQKPTS